METNEMIYAPVLIPTINRYQHFKDCIESLARCTWADKTDVFVAVDYPPNDYYWEGYKKIKDFLDNCGDLGFKSLNVVYRETNYFFSGKGNIETLVKDVEKNFDRYIITEDDNVFSPNFLVYIDKGLERYKDDQSVLAIVGYKHFLQIKCSDNTFFRQNVDFSAWGYGIWSDRMANIELFSSNFGFYKTFSLSKAIKLYKNGRYRFAMYLHLASRKKKYVMYDNPLSVYMAVNDMDIIMPTISLVRNLGWDNTGIHCSSKDHYLAEMHKNQEISKDRGFDYVGTGFEYYDENKSIFANSKIYVNTSVLKLIKAIASFLIVRTITLFKSL